MIAKQLAIVALLLISSVQIDAKKKQLRSLAVEEEKDTVKAVEKEEEEKVKPSSSVQIDATKKKKKKKKTKKTKKLPSLVAEGEKRDSVKAVEEEEEKAEAISPVQVDATEKKKKKKKKQLSSLAAEGKKQDSVKAVEEEEVKTKVISPVQVDATKEKKKKKKKKLSSLAVEGKKQDSVKAVQEEDVKTKVISPVQVDATKEKKKKKKKKKQLRSLAVEEEKEMQIKAVEEEKKADKEKTRGHPGKNVFLNAGAKGKSSYRNGSTLRTHLRLEKTDKDIDYSMAFEGYREHRIYQEARVLPDGFKYTWEDENYANSCYDYDLVIGFAELDEAFCFNKFEPEKRVFSIDIDAGSKESVATNLDIVAKTGGCYKAYTIKKSFTPKNKTIDIEFKEDKESDGYPMISFISIKRQEKRRLGADCDD